MSANRYIGRLPWAIQREFSSNWRERRDGVSVAFHHCTQSTATPIKRRYLAPRVIVELEVRPLHAKRLILRSLSALGHSRHCRCGPKLTFVRSCPKSDQKWCVAAN